MKAKEAPRTPARSWWLVLLLGGGSVIALAAPSENETASSLPTTAPLTVRLTGPPAKYVHITCTDGYAQKALVDSASSATATDVPIGEDCNVTVESGSDVARFSHAVAGQSYVCDVRPPELICRSDGLAGGAISVKLTGTAPASGFTVSCPGGFRGRAALSEGTGVVYGVPLGEVCALTFQGGAVSKFPDARAGFAYVCDLTPPTAGCRP